jgi:dihydroflavonol-4-reductase
MKKMYIVTGAAGHLASTIIRYLSKFNCSVRGLILPGEHPAEFENTEYYTGDVTRPETLDEIFSGIRGYAVTVFHVAGLISIASHITPRLYDVNVNGTRNVIAMCFKNKVKRLVYVSSVHAIPEAPDKATITEVRSFSSENVDGAYAKTKALASESVVEAARAGLDAVIVHPSGIIGPFDEGRNHMVQLIADYISGKLPASVSGGYDFVDVRDVAKGCILAAEKGKAGESYILSNRYCSIKDLLEYTRLAINGRKRPCVPIWLAKAAAPAVEYFGRLLHKRPLYTRYALRTLQSNSIFSHNKATAELGFKPRDLKKTVTDTAKWLTRKKRKNCT